MRIAMIQTYLLGRAGGERQVLRLAIELQRLGHEVEIFTSAVDEEKCYPELLKEVRVNVISYPPISFLSRGKYYTSIFPSMLNIGRKIPRRFDIINNHNFPSEWAALIAKRRLKVPVVWMCNEPPFWFFHSQLGSGVRSLNWPLFEVFDKFAVEYIDEIVVLSHIAEELVKKIYNRLPKILRSGVDVEFFHNASGQEIREKYHLEHDFVLLQVGSLVFYKRQIDSIKALFYLSKKYDNVKLILDGPGEQETLRDRIKKLGLEDKVIFSLANDDKELAKIYAACDVFVFPCELTWGLAVTEAMASARPVIVSKKAGASEIIENNVNGIVVDHANPREMAEKLEILMNNPKLRKKLGQNAYRHVKKKLPWKKYAENMESIFQQTVSKFKRSPEEQILERLD